MYKNDIGINAGVIWHLLSEKGELTNFREPFIYLALGWLSRENKIHFYEKNGAVYAELNQIVSEMYF